MLSPRRAHLFIPNSERDLFVRFFAYSAFLARPIMTC
jgi:hypothetical protein